MINRTVDRTVHCSIAQQIGTEGFAMWGTALALIASMVVAAFVAHWRWKRATLNAMRAAFDGAYHRSTHDVDDAVAIARRTLVHSDCDGDVRRVRVMLLISVHSGHAVMMHCVRDVLRAFNRCGVVVHVRVCQNAHYASNLDFDHKYFDALCVAGGDSLLAEVIQGFLERGIALPKIAILPSGTANSYWGMFAKDYALPRTKATQIEAAKRIADQLSRGVAPTMCSFLRADCFAHESDATPARILVGTISVSLQDFAACTEVANRTVMKWLGAFRYTVMYPVYLLLLALGFEQSCDVAATLEFDDDGVRHQCEALSGVSCLKIADMGRWNYEKLFPLCTYDSKCAGVTALTKRIPSLPGLQFLEGTVKGAVSPPFRDEKMGIEIRYFSSMDIRAQGAMMISTDGQNAYKGARRIRMSVVPQALSIYY